jgi:hypothetical protein
VAPVGTLFRRMCDHLTLVLVGRGSSVRIKVPRVCDMKSRAALRCGAPVRGPAVKIRFPRAFHFAAEMWTWECDGEEGNASLRVSQISAVVGFVLTNSMPAKSTTVPPL